MNERQVFLGNLPVLELPGETVVGGIVLCHHHDARRVPVKAVNNSGALHAALTGKIPYMMEESIH